MLLGPSTPLSALLFNYGISILSGARVVDEDATLRTIAQGGSFRQVPIQATISQSIGQVEVYSYVRTGWYANRSIKNPLDSSHFFLYYFHT